MLTTTPLVGHRIGAISALSGVPVSTLRVWETRYAAFSPRKSGGKQRLYSDDDVLRATLLKRLTELGHAISSIAQQDVAKLNELLSHQNSTRLRKASTEANARLVTLAVVNLALAARLTSKKFKQIFAPNFVQVTDIFPDLDAALSAPLNVQPQFLLVRVNSLHALVEVDLHRLIEKGNTPRVIVLYSFGQEKIVESMKRAGMFVRREPVSDYELADLISSALLVNAPRSMSQSGPDATIPPRKYDDAALARVAAISTSVLCECPRHVAEIIAQLVSFEQYSHECLNKSAEDAHLHAYLSAVSGSARALFEHALERVAAHEGLTLTEPL